MNKKDLSIRVEKLSKTFRLPESRKVTVQSYFVNPFERMTYRTFSPLRDLSFEVKEGEFFSIIGNNGVGKSTLLRIISGIYEPDSGTVSVRGRLVPFLELGVGFHPELTARENIYLNAILLGMKRTEVSSYFGDIVKFAGLEEFVDVEIKKFSSGMQVRLAFAIAVKVPSDVLVLDEVLAVGDAGFQKKCYGYFDSIKGKKTIIYVSHDLDSVLKYSDRVLYLRKDNSYEIGETRKVINQYSRESS